MTFGPEEEPRRVVVTDIRMPFWSMVMFMIKWAVASVPALVVLTALGILILGTLGALLRPALPF